MALGKRSENSTPPLKAPRLMIVLQKPKKTIEELMGVLCGHGYKTDEFHWSTKMEMNGNEIKQ